MTRALPPKHLAHFAFVEAMAHPGCFVCRLGQQAVVRKFDSLLYESVTDPAARARLKRGGGLCAEHGALLVKLGDALGAALLLRDLVRACGDAPRRRTASDCLGCETLGDVLEDLADELGQFAEDAELQAALRSARALCLPHGRALSGRLKSKPVCAIVKTRLQEQTLRLDRNLSEFIRKQDYQHRDETTSEAEASSWQEAESFLHGWHFSITELRVRR